MNKRKQGILSFESFDGNSSIYGTTQSTLHALDVIDQFIVPQAIKYLQLVQQLQ